MARRRVLALASQLLQRRRLPEPRFFSSAAAGALDLLSSPPFARPAAVSRNPAPPSPWDRFGGQRRTMFIQTQSTPNLQLLMFHPGKPVMEVEGSTTLP